MSHPFNLLNTGRQLPSRVEQDSEHEGTLVAVYEYNRAPHVQHIRG